MTEVEPKALPLESSRWGELIHAYGTAEDVPDMITELERFPTYENYRSEPYFSLWSAICHQGDVYTASFAALPHLVRIAESAPRFVQRELFVVVSAIEIARVNAIRSPSIPDDLESAYRNALNALPRCISNFAMHDWDELDCRYAGAALAVSKGHTVFADALLQLEPDIVRRIVNHEID